MPIDLSTTEKRLAVAGNFKDLLTHPGWKLFEIIVRDNIEVVKDQILSGSGEQTIEEVRRLRDKLAVHTEVIETVYKMIESLKPHEANEPPEFDPFEESTQK